MENFDFIRLSDSEESSKYLKKGFNNISNVAFGNVGLAVVFGYLFQCITTKESRYGLQLFRSIPELEIEGMFKNLKQNVLVFCKDFDISRLQQLCSGPVVDELKELVIQAFPDDSFAKISKSLRKFSKIANSRILIFHQDQVIEVNKASLSRPVLVCIAFNELSKVNLLTSEKDPVFEDSDKSEEILLEVIRISFREIKELPNFPIFFEDLGKYIDVLPDDLREELQEILSRTPDLKLRPPPVLKNLEINEDPSLSCHNEKILPMSVEETLEYLKDFQKKHGHSFKTVYAKKEKVKFSLDGLPIGIPSINPSKFKPYQMPLTSGSGFASSPPHNFNHRCDSCRNYPIDIPGNPHNCKLCEQCTFETMLTHECIRCKYKYQDSELEILRVFLPCN